MVGTCVKYTQLVINGLIYAQTPSVALQDTDVWTQRCSISALFLSRRWQWSWLAQRERVTYTTSQILTSLCLSEELSICSCWPHLSHWAKCETSGCSTTTLEVAHHGSYYRGWDCVYSVAINTLSATSDQGRALPIKNSTETLIFPKLSVAATWKWRNLIWNLYKSTCSFMLFLSCTLKRYLHSCVCFSCLDSFSSTLNMCIIGGCQCKPVNRVVKAMYRQHLLTAC